MRRLALIDNPKAGQRQHARLLDAILAELRRGGFEVEAVPTAGPGDATRLAREIAAAGWTEAVLAFGGDGTVREVAAGLLGSEVALGILPGGTVNLLARALGLPGEPVAAAAGIANIAGMANLPVRSLDVGLAGGSPFLMMVSAGLDARVLSILDGDLKRRFGQAGILWQGLAEWWRYPYPSLTLRADGRSHAATFVAVANIPLYAGPYRLVPEARPDDGRLELLLFRGGRAATLGFALDLFRGARHLRRQDVTILSAQEVILEAPPDLAAQVDGDLCREALPLTIRLAPEKLRVLAPEVPR
ncbi:MAG TPA: diacylglycerol kinase family protein [Thermoanaerobaculia bacterium]|nr:diacylglycerol kinase family protein [Thermoanaerobaculia bacterium]